MEIAYCLYRVSTKKQVDKEGNDIPMQKMACREFAERMGWIIAKEFEEKGVSGFKVSASDRDAIQDLKDAAMRKEFTTLLVFMFDRIGRIDDETPFVVEWFAKHGIRVWSVKEGEQRFDSHTDKLTNYIRFWQASGESEKTSMRIKTRMRQLTLEGQYTGGTLPYGYKLIKTGRVNKKGYEIHDLAIEPMEAEMVREIFRMTIRDGYGSHRMAEYLNKQGLRTHKGTKFQSNTIIRILKNRMYCGYLTAGDITSPQLMELKIVEKEDFDRAQEIVKQRAAKNREKSQIAMSTKGKGMLSGNIYCAHCGGRLTTIRYRDKYIRKDGSVYEVDQIKYSCYHKARKLCESDGQATYKAEKVDAVVSEFMQKLFRGLQGAPEEERLKILYKNKMAGNRAHLTKLETQMIKDQKQLETLKLEIAKCLTGDSAFSQEDLIDAMNTLRNRIEDVEKQMAGIREDENDQQAAMAKIFPVYKRFKSWAEEFETATLEQKKMIACQLFKRIEVGKDYQICFEMNLTYQDFCTEWNATEELLNQVG